MPLSIRWLILLGILVNGFAYYWLGAEQQLRHARSISPEYDGDPKLGSDARLVLLVDAKSPGRTLAGGLDATGRGDATKGQPSQMSVGGESSSARPLCWFVGPFTDWRSAKQFGDRSEATSIAIRHGPVAAMKSNAQPRIWVVLFEPPEVDARDVQIKRLRTERIDYFVFSSGPLEGALSVGLYTKRKDAESWRNVLIARGYAAHIFDASGNDTFWVEIPLRGRGRAVDGVEHTQQVSSSPLRTEQAGCESRESMPIP